MKSFGRSWLSLVALTILVPPFAFAKGQEHPSPETAIAVSADASAFSDDDEDRAEELPYRTEDGSDLSEDGSAISEDPVAALPPTPWWSAWKPDSALMQHAAYGGYLAMGIGYFGRDQLALDLLYGFTPATYAGHDVHSFQAKGLLYLASIGLPHRRIWRPYLGLSAIYSPDAALFVRLPRQYPAFYYQPTALRPLLLAGLDLQMGRSYGLSVEYALIDSELAYLRDGGKLSSDAIGSWGFGLRVWLE